MSRSRAQIAQDIAFYKTQLAACEMELENKGLPKEPEVGTVIKFLVQFPQRPITYQYWAVRFHNKLWTITGKTGAYSWREVVMFMKQDEGIQKGARKVEFTVVGK